MALFSNNISRLFENNPVNRVGPTGQPLLGGSNITDLATRSLGGLLGREVRSRPEQLTAALAQIDPKAPDAQEQQLRILAQLGAPQQQLLAVQQLGQRGATRAAKEQEQRFRASLIARNNALGGGEERAETIAGASPDMLGDLRKEIRSEEQAAALKNSGIAGRFAIGQAAGLTREQVKTLSNLPDEKFTEIINAQKAEEKAFRDSEGNVSTYRVNDFAMVATENPNGTVLWKTPEELNIVPAAKETKDIGRANELTSKLAAEGVKDFREVTEKARQSYRALDVNRSRLKILDENPDLITGGALSELTTTALITLGSSLGIEIPATADAVAAQLLIAQGVEAVGQSIQMFGAGTGLSDADREFAKLSAGATQDLTAANIRRMIELANEQAEETINLHQRIYGDLKKGGAAPSSLSFYQAGPKLPDSIDIYYK